MRSNCKGINVSHHLRTMRYQGVYSQEHNIFDIYVEHFALFSTCTPYRRSRHSTPQEVSVLAVYDFGHRKERKEREVRKDSLNCLVFDYNAVKIRSLMQ